MVGVKLRVEEPIALLKRRSTAWGQIKAEMAGASLSAVGDFIFRNGSPVWSPPGVFAVEGGHDVPKSAVS